MPELELIYTIMTILFMMVFPPRSHIHDHNDAPDDKDAKSLLPTTSQGAGRPTHVPKMRIQRTRTHRILHAEMQGLRLHIQNRSRKTRRNILLAMDNPTTHLANTLLVNAKGKMTENHHPPSLAHTKISETQTQRISQRRKHPKMKKR